MTVEANGFTELQHENTTSLVTDNFCKLAINLPIFSHKAAFDRYTFKYNGRERRLSSKENINYISGN